MPLKRKRPTQWKTHKKCWICEKQGKWKLNSLTSEIRIKSDKMIFSEVRTGRITVQEEQTE